MELTIKKTMTETQKLKSQINYAERELFTSAQRRKAVIEAKYIDQLQKFD